MAKFKHNKKRNSAFIYEALIQELTRAVLDKNVQKQHEIKAIIKESFNRNTESYKELKLYKAITETNGISGQVAERVLNEVKLRHQNIDKDKLLQEQNVILKKIKKNFENDVFSNFVPNYKNLASISQIFSQNITVKSKVLLEKNIVDTMTVDNQKETELKPIDNLVFKSFTKRFNEEYGDKLLQEQKELLNRYITSFDNNGIELKVYLEEEIGRLKEAVKKSFDTEEIQQDQTMQTNANKVLEMLESYKARKPDQQMIQEISKIQSLVREFQEDGN
jgi:hypothetical protein